MISSDAAFNELQYRRRRAGNVEVVGHPVDRQRRVGARVDVVDLEVVGSRDPLRREPRPQTALDLDLGVLGTGDLAGGPAAEQPRLQLRLHHHVALALGQRPVLLIDDVGEADPGDLADHDAAIFDLGADVEALHRLVEVGLEGDPRLEPAPAADDQQQHDRGAHRPQHEQARA